MKLSMFTQKARLVLLLACLLGTSHQWVFAESPSEITIAQERYLSEILDELGEKYQVFFNYESNLIEDIRLEFELKKGESLNQAVNRLMQLTNLQYELTGEKFVIIYKNTKQGKNRAKKTRKRIKKLQKLEQTGDIQIQRRNSDPVKQSLNMMRTVKEIQEAVQTVSGAVTDEAGTPLIGASVYVKGSGAGTVTDLDGTFSLEVPSGDAVLVFSYTGYVTQELTVGNQTQVSVILVEDTQTLDEVVVVGYGTRRKGDISGAVTSVNKDYVDQQAVGNLSRALQGSTSGLTVVTGTNPGAGAQIRIRGLGTINDNGPLWVVDGIFDAPQPPPSQVESIQVLKDASATAIYGARGANGVILVTTKGGKANQKPQIEFSLRTGFISPASKYNISTDPNEIGQMLWLEQTNDGIDPAHPHFGSGDQPVLNDFLFPNGAAVGDPSTDLSLYDQQSYPITRSTATGTDWLDVIYQNGITQDYNMSVTGGSEKTQYAFVGSYLEEEGLLQYTKFSRYALRSNVTSRVAKWLRVGETLSVNFTQNKGYNQNNNNGIFRLINEVSPLIPVRDEAGNFAGGIVGGSLNDGPNPLGQLFRQKDNYNRNFGISGNFFAEALPVEGMSVKTLFGYTVNNGSNFFPRLPAFEDTNGARTTALSRGVGSSITWNWSNTLNYNKTFNEVHNIGILLGAEMRETRGDGLSASRDGFFSNDLNFLVLNAGEGNQQNGGSAFETSTLSQFGRIQYNYQSRYLFDATLRRDGSSVLGNEKFGIFPAFSAAWRLSEEAFLSDIGWINDLKIRGSWGQSGNDQTNNPYNSFSTFASNPGGSFYAIDGSDNNITLGYQSQAIGNPDAKWETTTSSNIAIDATLFNNFDVTVDLWSKNTTDMLFNVPVPGVVGLATPPAVNIGAMENTGIDLTLDYRGKIGSSLPFTIAATFTAYRNEITELSGVDNDFIPGRDLRGQTYTRAQAGHSFPEFFGYVVDGIFQTEAEADAHPENGSYNAPGNLIIKDVDGDGIITPADRTFIGNPHPDFTAGLRFGLDYKGFDFNATLYASVGNDLVNYTSRFRDYGLFQGPKSPDRLYRSWGSPFLENNADAILPKASSTTAFEQNASTEYIEDGSFLRMQNIQLGYNLPQSMLSKMRMSGFRLYVLAENLFTITGYSGLNPEVIGADINRGVDIGVWPAAQRFMVGLNIKL